MVHIHYVIAFSFRYSTSGSRVRTSHNPDTAHQQQQQQTPSRSNNTVQTFFVFAFPVFIQFMCFPVAFVLLLCAGAATMIRSFRLIPLFGAKNEIEKIIARSSRDEQRARWQGSETGMEIGSWWEYGVISPGQPADIDFLLHTIVWRSDWCAEKLVQILVRCAALSVVTSYDSNTVDNAYGKCLWWEYDCEIAFAKWFDIAPTVNACCCIVDMTRHSMHKHSPLTCAPTKWNICACIRIPIKSHVFRMANRSTNNRLDICIMIIYTFARCTIHTIREWKYTHILSFFMVWERDNFVAGQSRT